MIDRLRAGRARGFLALGALCTLSCARGAPPATAPRLALAPAELYEYLRPAAGERAVVANFWATWCGPCLAEMPHLVELARAHADDGVRVVAVSIDVPMPLKVGTPEEVHAFADQREIDLPVVALVGDWDEVIEHYGMSGPVPYTIVVDGSGTVVERQEGAADAERFERMLDALAPASE